MSRSLTFPYEIKSINKKITIFLSFLFVIFSFWGADWFHYLHLYSGLKIGDPGHMENIYVSIAQNISVGYISFRLCIWGISLLLLYFMFKHITIKYNLLIIMFCSIWIIWFSYARVSVSMVFAYLAMLCIIKPLKYKVTSYLLGILLLIASVYFHKTAYFAVFVVCFTVLSIRLNRYSFIVLLLLFLLLAIKQLPLLLSDFAIGFSSDDGMMGQAIDYGAKYMNSSIVSAGVGSQVQAILERFPYYMLTLECLVFMSRKSYKTIPTDVLAFMRLFVVIVLVATLFSLNYNLNTQVIYARFLRFASIPAVVALSYFWEIKHSPKLTKCIFIMALLGTWYSVMYSMYCIMMS